MSIPSIPSPLPRLTGVPAFSGASVPQAGSGAQPASDPVHGLGAYSSRDRIPNDVYYLLNKAPKNELHVHQGGSSSVEFLSFCLREAIDQNQALYQQQQVFKVEHPTLPVTKALKTFDRFPVFQEMGPPKWVRFTDNSGQPLPAYPLRQATEEALTLDNLRSYYRYQLEAENQKSYKDIEDIAETTARYQPRTEIVSATESAALQKHKAEGLQAYRMTSDKINPFVKNNPAAYKLANEYAKSMASENIRYTEYRVSPSGNGIGGANGSNAEDVLSSVYSGFEDAKRHLKQRNYNLDYGLIVLFERQNRFNKEAPEPPDAKILRAIDLANHVVRLKREGKYNICGVDLAGDEANNPVTEFKEAFAIIRRYNATVPPKKRLGITIHAGETPNSKHLKGYQSIDEAIQVAHDKKTSVRIGHGLQIINSSSALQQAFKIYCEHPTNWETLINKDALIKNSPLLQKVIHNKIVLEMCPKSNLQTYGIHPGFPGEEFSVRRDEYSAKSYSRHPAVFLSRLGVKVAISSDNRTISNTDVTNEFVKLFKYAGLTYDDFKKMVMNGFEGAFIADPQKRAAVMQDVQRQFQRMEKDPDAIHAIRTMQRTPQSKWEWLMATISRQKQTLFSTLGQWYAKVKNWFARHFSKR